MGNVSEGEKSFESLLSVIFDQAITEGMNHGSAGFMAYIPGGTVYPICIADVISQCLNRYTGKNNQK